jgi:hypothetical protein
MIRTRLSPSALRVLVCASFLVASVSTQACAQAVNDQTQPPATSPIEYNQAPDHTGPGVQSGRLSFIEENDYFASHDDRHYTQGLRVTLLFDTIPEDNHKDCDWMGGGLSFYESGSCKREYEWTVIGQNLYTPQNLNVSTQISKDRPYGAWLYTGVSLLQEHAHETHDTLDNFELQGGVVGPLALGAEAQNGFHQLIGDSLSNGWNNQIHTEPGFVLVDERKWRFEGPMTDYFSVDAIPEIGATVGNVFDYGEVGGLVRFGHNLRSDYGQNRIRPSLSGTGWFDKDQLTDPLGWYLFAGSQGRAVGRNLFLDGNTFGASSSVEHKPFVADFTAGASMFWSEATRADFSVTERTKEFYGQPGHPDRFGAISVVFGL